MTKRKQSRDYWGRVLLENPDCISTVAAATALGVSRWTVTAMMRAGTLRCRRLGRRHVLPMRRAVEALARRRG